METQVFEQAVYRWGDGLALTGLGEGSGAHMELVVGAERAAEARDLLLRRGWRVRSFRDLDGRPGVFLQAEKG